MASPFFSGRIPQELSDRINQHCNETGESKTQVLLNALSKYLDFPIKPPATITISTERFNQLEQRVTELEKKLEITTVSSVDNIIITENEIADNNTNLVEQPDNNLIQEGETGDNNADIVKQSDNIDNSNSQDVEPVSESQTQLSILSVEEQQVESDQGDRKPWIIKTNDAPNLPGLEEMNKQKILQKLRNTKSTKKAETEIGQYLLKYCGQEPGAKGSLLWEVTKI